MKTGETRLERTVILGSDAVLKSLFHFVNGSFQAVYTKRMYSSPIILVCQLLLLAQNKCYLLKVSRHAVIPR